MDERQIRLNHLKERLETLRTRGKGARSDMHIVDKDGWESAVTSIAPNSAEVEQLLAALQNADQDWEKLEPALVSRLAALEKGYDVATEKFEEKAEDDPRPAWRGQQ